MFSVHFPLFFLFQVLLCVYFKLIFLMQILYFNIHVNNQFPFILRLRISFSEFLNCEKYSN